MVTIVGPSEQILLAGTSLNLTYSLVEGGMATATRWYKDAEPLTVGGRVGVLGQSLLVGSLERGDAGQYSVEVDNDAGTSSAVATVTIQCE